MRLAERLKTTFRGDLSAGALAREALRRIRAGRHLARERELVDAIAAVPPRLVSGLNPEGLREIVLLNDRASFWGSIPARALPDEEVSRVKALAAGIVDRSSWELLGFGDLTFRGDAFWRCDPVNGHEWELDFHADVALTPPGADIRILWELNRFGHAMPLALAFSATGNETYAETFFAHVESWVAQNPYGRGPNWTCAMEVALRAINLLAAFDVFRHSNLCSDNRVRDILQLFDQHGRFIVENSEFSYISTSNHYFSNVAGLFWLGTLVPELEHAERWRTIGWRELRREMRKQMLPDGANFESSTGYHRFITELILYTFVLARRSGDEIGEDDLDILRKAEEYIRAIQRPDERMPLIGDADGSQIIPIVRREADECVYLLQLFAALFDDAGIDSWKPAPEVWWLCGPQKLAQRELGPQGSTACPDAGAYVMRSDDLYLHFNANDVGLRGRGSHGHNDALAIEICAFGVPFIVNPGSYVYNLDRHERDRFRSTAYHSTVTVDDTEQNTTRVDMPFKMGNEARPKVLEWYSDETTDRVVAEHYGYRRLDRPVVHRRMVVFNKQERYWSMTDEILGEGEHEISFRFHISDVVSISMFGENVVESSASNGGRLLICPSPSHAPPIVSDAFVSRSYGHRKPSRIVHWTVNAIAPLRAEWLLIPISTEEDVGYRLSAVQAA